MPIRHRGVEGKKKKVILHLNYVLLIPEPCHRKFTLGNLSASSSLEAGSLQRNM